MGTRSPRHITPLGHARRVRSSEGSERASGLRPLFRLLVRCVHVQALLNRPAARQCSHGRTRHDSSQGSCKSIREESAGLCERAMVLKHSEHSPERWYFRVAHDGKALEKAIRLGPGPGVSPNRATTRPPCVSCTGCPPTSTGLSHEREKLKAFGNAVLLGVEVCVFPGLGGFGVYC